MNKQEYIEYKKIVNAFMDKCGPISDSYVLDDEFSVNPCECCNSTLPGPRYIALAGDHDVLLICANCKHYITWCELDELTMMSL